MATSGWRHITKQFPNYTFNNKYIARHDVIFLDVLKQHMLVDNIWRSSCNRIVDEAKQ